MKTKFLLPNWEKCNELYYIALQIKLGGGILKSPCMSVCLSVRLSFCLSVDLRFYREQVLETTATARILFSIFILISHRDWCISIGDIQGSNGITMSFFLFFCPSVCLFCLCIPFHVWSITFTRRNIRELWLVALPQIEVIGKGQGH